MQHADYNEQHCIAWLRVAESFSTQEKNLRTYEW